MLLRSIVNQQTGVVHTHMHGAIYMHLKIYSTIVYWTYLFEPIQMSSQIGVNASQARDKWQSWIMFLFWIMLLFCMKRAEMYKSSTYPQGDSQGIIVTT